MTQFQTSQYYDCDSWQKSDRIRRDAGQSTPINVQQVYIEQNERQYINLRMLYIIFWRQISTK